MDWIQLAYDKIQSREYLDKLSNSILWNTLPWSLLKYTVM